MIFLLGNTLACVVTSLFLNINDKRKVSQLHSYIYVALFLRDNWSWTLSLMVLCLLLKSESLLVTCREIGDHWLVKQESQLEGPPAKILPKNCWNSCFPELRKCGVFPTYWGVQTTVIIKISWCIAILNYRITNMFDIFTINITNF